jgi:hypothetical protein
MRKTLVLLLLCVRSLSYSQVNSVDFPHIIPASPTIAALDKFGNYPIGYNTGTVGISVPLYKFPLGKGADLNISLDYHSSGIKVDDSKGIVGLGWALSAGGYISREIRGMRDEVGGGFYDYIKTHKGYTFPSNPLASTYPSLFDSINSTSLDPEPDLFSLDMLGRRYKFFFGNDGEFHTIPYSNIKFQASALESRLGRDTWNVIDESGIHYIFDVVEVTDENGRLGHVTAWKLSRVVSAEGTTLATFEYSSADENGSTLTRRTKAFAMFDHGVASEQRSSVLELKETTLQYTFEGQALSKITIPGTGSLAFTYTWTNGMQLVGIAYQTPEGQKKESFGFNYDYSTDYLSGITRTSGSSASTSYRTFTYNLGLPGRGSFSQDFWGYYNGANNPSLFPEVGNMGNDPAPNHQYESADRYPTNKAIAGSLKEIIYPTGGKTLFEFENNKIRAEESTATVQKVSESYTHSGFGQKSSGTFTAIQEKMPTQMIFSIHPAGLYSISIKLVRTDDNKVITSINETQVTNSSAGFTLQGTNSDGTIRYQYTSNPVLPAGTYQWVTQIIDNEVRPRITPQPITISYSYYKNVVTTTSEKMVGGLRILRITNYDKGGAVTDQTRYTYLNKDGKCSGVGAPEPQFIKSYVLSLDRKTLTPLSVLTLTYLGVEEIGEVDLTRYTGSAVQYAYVTEEKLNGTSPALKTEYDYNVRSFVRNVIPTIGDRGYVPVPYNPNDYAEGLLLAKTDYKYENGAYTPVKKERNTYTIEERGSDIPAFRALSVTKYYIDPIPDEPVNYDNRFKYGTYDLIAAKVYLSSKQIEDLSGSSPVITTTNYSYDNSFYVLPTSTTVNKSGGRSMQTSYRYSFDETSSPYDDMKTKNMINMPVTITTATDNVRTSQTSIQYDYFNNGSMIEPSIARKQNGLSGVYDETLYNAYDNDGNPLHLSHNGVNSTYYLWSYKGKYPVAEIKGGNYTFAQIETAVNNVFSIAGINALSEQESPNESKLRDGSLQSALPDALVVTYTYNPRGGILTTTTSNSVVTDYEYDNFERLLKSSTGNKTDQQYDYHYQNQ